MRNRPGFTLPDLLVTLVVMGVIGASLAQVMVVQSQFYSKQEGRSAARAVSRSASNIIMSDLRMIETSNGVVAATPTSLTLRVPYAMGIVCDNSGGGTDVTLPPVDSVILAEAGFSGYAWRDASGNYNYVESGVSLGNGSAASCTANGLTAIAGGTMRRLAPPAPMAVVPGTPVFLYQRVVYSLTTSVSVPGSIGLWRTIVDRSLAEEIVAPFDSSAVFRFFVDGSPTAQAAVPSPLSDIRGIELQLTGINERAHNRNLEERTPYTTAVFFKNRM